jgi:hypothetical protein
VIASIIGALSAGYPIGGWLADRRPGPLLPFGMLLVGGLLGAAMGVVVPHWLRTALAGIAFTGFAFWGRLGTVLLGVFFPIGLRGQPTRAVATAYIFDPLGTVVGFLLFYLIALQTGIALAGATGMLCYVAACALLRWPLRLR